MTTRDDMEARIEAALARISLKGGILTGSGRDRSYTAEQVFLMLRDVADALRGEKIVTRRETLEEFVERRRVAHLSYDETERELYEMLGERDGLLVAAKVNGQAFTKLFQKIAQLETANEQLRAYQSMHDTLEACVKLANSERDGALARIEAARVKLLIYAGYATPDQLREAMREAVKILR